MPYVGIYRTYRLAVSRLFWRPQKVLAQQGEKARQSLDLLLIAKQTLLVYTYLI